MSIFLETLSEFNAISVMFKLVVAMVVGGLIGFERGKHGRAAGFRTHILICVGATLTSIIGIYVCQSLGASGDATRISAQVISGIGFLGVGTILVRNRSIVTGLTTAAGLWTTAIIGLAVGYGLYVASFFATIICILSFTVLNYLESKRKKVAYIYVELNDVLAMNKLRHYAWSSNGLVVLSDVIPSKSGVINSVGVICVITNNEELERIEQDLDKIEEVSYVFNLVS